MHPFLGLAFSVVLLCARGGATSSIDNKTYEYIVVGSGPGGGPIASNLARAGHSVLLVEAGYVHAAWSCAFS
jgi:choline dehydrogenase